MNAPLRLGFLASHNGSNLRAIVAACSSGALNATPGVVIGNNSRAGALLWSGEQGLPTFHRSGHTHPTPADLDGTILKLLLDHGVEVLCLAGYMKRLGPQTLAAYRGRILNIHPSLLPKYGGKGFYGMAVHRAVLAAGDLQSGATVHLVDEEYDHGRILAQQKVPVLPDDTPDTLAARVLTAEHQLYPTTLQQIASGQISLEGLRRPPN